MIQSSNQAIKQSSNQAIKHKSILSLILFSLLLFYLTGCASIVRGSKQPLTVYSNVQGADVYVDGHKVGETPFSDEIDRKKSILLEVRKEGYTTVPIRLNTSMESAFWGNIILGGPLGSTVDFATGSMWKISPNTYNVDLKKN